MRIFKECTPAFVRAFIEEGTKVVSGYSVWDVLAGEEPEWDYRRIDWWFHNGNRHDKKLAEWMLMKMSNIQHWAEYEAQQERCTLAALGF